VQKPIDSRLVLALSVMLLTALLLSVSVAPTVLAASNSGPGRSGGSDDDGNLEDDQVMAPLQSANTSMGSNDTLQLSGQPVAVGHYSTGSENFVNNTIHATIVGNTTITLPNSTETITTNDTGNVTITFTQSGSATLEAQVNLTTGSENATITATELFRNEGSPGIGVASFSTDSTGKLAPLDGIMTITVDEDQPDGSARVSFFELQGVPMANQTETPDNTTGGTSPSASATGSGTQVSITSGSQSKTTDAFDPNPVQAKVGDTVTWTNDDSTPHTVTSGSNAQPDGKFDSSPNLNPLLAPGQIFKHTFDQAGEYPYYCQLHPNMVGTVSVS